MEDRSQPPRRVSLVLLPGLDGTGRLFKWLIAALPPCIEPIVISLSAGAEYAALAKSAVRSLPHDRPFVLLGESFSGPLALRIAADNPPGLVAVILVASFVKHPLAWAAAVAPYIVRFLASSSPFRRFALRRLVFGRHAPTDLIEQISATIGAVDQSVLADRAKAALTADVTGELIRCPVPLLYLGGARDRLMHQNVKRLRAVCPGLEYQIVDAPHFVLQGAPVPAAQAITDFISEHYQFDSGKARPEPNGIRA
jgi:pimeloyl-ACP methyl ester carboxylesterase